MDIFLTLSHSYFVFKHLLWFLFTLKHFYWNGQTHFMSSSHTSHKTVSFKGSKTLHCCLISETHFGKHIFQSVTIYTDLLHSQSVLQLHLNSCCMSCGLIVSRLWCLFKHLKLQCCLISFTWNAENKQIIGCPMTFNGTIFVPLSVKITFSLFMFGSVWHMASCFVVH